jgi:hypothetical protein
VDNASVTFAAGGPVRRCTGDRETSNGTQCRKTGGEVFGSLPAPRFWRDAKGRSSLRGVSSFDPRSGATARVEPDRL